LKREEERGSGVNGMGSGGGGLRLASGGGEVWGRRGRGRGEARTTAVDGMGAVAARNGGGGFLEGGSDEGRAAAKGGTEEY
jgi:hypothetical protein